MNLASRLESAGKIYGTAIILGEATWREAGERIVARQLDHIAVYGRSKGTAIFDLRLQAELPPSAWACRDGRAIEGPPSEAVMAVTHRLATIIRPFR